jgi:hypothetical protein
MRGEQLILILRFLLLTAMKAIRLLNPKDRDRAQGRKESQKPPREDDIALINSIGKRCTDKCRPRGSSNRTDTRADPVQGPQHTEAGCRVGQEDGAAGKAEDGACQLAEHEQEHHKMPERCWYESREGRHEVNDREDGGNNFEAVEDAESLGCCWEDEELNKHADNADQGVEYADRLGVYAESVKMEARERERDTYRRRTRR